MVRVITFVFVTIVRVATMIAWKTEWINPDRPDWDRYWKLGSYKNPPKPPPIKISK